MINISLDGNEPVVKITKSNQLSVADLAMILFYLKNGQFADKLLNVLKECVEEEDVDKILTTLSFTENYRSNILNSNYLEQCMTPIVPQDMVKFYK